MPDLQPNGNPVRLGRTVLRTPGLAGVATSHLPDSAAMRSAELATADFEAALASEALQTVETIEISSTRETPSGAAGTRSTSHGEPAIELTVPDPGASWGQVVLAVDESGIATWSFARDQRGDLDVTRGGETRTYLIPRRVAPALGAAETRGLIGAAGKKLLKVLVFPLVDPVVGEVSDFFAARWEAKHRPYRLRTFESSSYRDLEARSLEAGDWQRLAAGRALLFVHGTFSYSHAGFGALPSAFLDWAHERYEGRVFALDHPSVSVDPRENVEWLVGQPPADARLELDIICHSRGGLVSRVLSEGTADLSLGSREVSVKKVVFLATPNAGTILADADHHGDLVDTYTNVLNFFPDNGVTEVLQAVIAVVKQIAVGAFRGLDGLRSMVPGGAFLAALNASPKAAAHYYALAADYEPPSESGLKLFAKDLLFDRIFGRENDLVVPTSGVWEVPGSANFPIEERHVFDATAGMAHSGFARNAQAIELMERWLAPD